jgi:hypothetical protein
MRDEIAVKLPPEVVQITTRVDEMGRAVVNLPPLGLPANTVYLRDALVQSGML